MTLALCTEKHNTSVGKQKENIDIIGLNVCALKEGQKIKVGEVEMLATAALKCKGEDPNLTGERGTFFTPLNEGKIKLGDSVKLI